MIRILTTIIFIFSSVLASNELSREVTSNQPSSGSRIAQKKIEIIEKKLKGDLKPKEKSSYLYTHAVMMASQGNFVKALDSTEKLLSMHKDMTKYKINRTLKLPIFFGLRQKMSASMKNEALLFDRLIANYLAIFLQRGNMVEDIEEEEVKEEKLNMIASWLLGRMLEYNLTLDSKLPLPFENLLLIATRIQKPITKEKILAYRKRVEYFETVAETGSFESHNRNDSIKIANIWFYTYMTGSERYNFLKNQIPVLVGMKIKNGHSPKAGKTLRAVLASISKNIEITDETLKMKEMTSSTLVEIQKLKRINERMEGSLYKALNHKNRIYTLSTPKGLSTKDRNKLTIARNKLVRATKSYKTSKAYLDKVKSANSAYKSKLHSMYSDRYNEVSKRLERKRASYTRLAEQEQ